MKILIYTGHHHTQFTMGQWRDTGGNGVCNSTIQIAEALAAQNHEVTVSGEVSDEEVRNIQFRDTDSIKKGSHFDIGIAVSYLHYLKALSLIHI